MAPQRSEPRYSLAVSIRVIDAETGADIGEIVNVSAHGLMIASSEALTLERRYRLRLVPPPEVAEPLEVSAEAVWRVRSLDPPCMQTGFRGMGLATAERARLDRLIEASYTLDED